MSFVGTNAAPNYYFLNLLPAKQMLGYIYMRDLRFMMMLVSVKLL